MVEKCKWRLSLRSKVTSGITSYYNLTMAPGRYHINSKYKLLLNLVDFTNLIILIDVISIKNKLANVRLEIERRNERGFWKWGPVELRLYLTIHWKISFVRWERYYTNLKFYDYGAYLAFMQKLWILPVLSIVKEKQNVRMSKWRWNWKNRLCVVNR